MREDFTPQAREEVGEPYKPLETTRVRLPGGVHETRLTDQAEDLLAGEARLVPAIFEEQRYMTNSYSRVHAYVPLETERVQLPDGQFVTVLGPDEEAKLLRERALRQIRFPESYNSSNSPFVVLSELGRAVYTEVQARVEALFSSTRTDLE